MKKENGNTLAVRQQEGPSVIMMLQKVVDGGINTENVAALQSLVDLHERVQRRDAEKEYNKSFAQLQSELPQISATKPVPNKDGSVRYRFAPYEEILREVQPLLTNHGFSVSFTTKPVENGRLTVVCTLRHIDGHSVSNEFAVRIGQGPPGSSETQADGAAKTYAKRGAFADALNIVIDHDDDARMVGKPIGRALAEDLQQRVVKCGADEEAFLKFAGVAAKTPPTIDDYMQISDERFEALDRELKKKESRRV